MSDDIEPNEDETRAAEYVLGLLNADEAAAFELLMATDPAARADYARWAEDFAGLTDEIAEAEPPAELLDRIRSAAFGTAALEEPAPKPVPSPPRKSSWMERLGLLPAMGGGLVAAMIALWAINVYLGPVIDPPATATVQLASADDSLVVEVGYVENSEILQVTRLAGAAPEGQVLELWVIQGDSAPVSLGILPDDSGEMVIADYKVGLLRGAQCAISVEPPGGSPTGAPTGDIVAVAPVVWVG